MGAHINPIVGLLLVKAMFVGINIRKILLPTRRLHITSQEN